MTGSGAHQLRIRTAMVGTAQCAFAHPTSWVDFDGPAPLDALQGLLAKPASAGDVARPAVDSVSHAWATAEPDESEYLHLLRARLHPHHEGPQHHHRCHGAVCGLAGLYG